MVDDSFSAASDVWRMSVLWQGRRQSLMKKPMRDGAPEEEGGQERALAMRSRGPGRGGAMQGQEGGDVARRPPRRYKSLSPFLYDCLGG